MIFSWIFSTLTIINIFLIFILINLAVLVLKKLMIYHQHIKEQDRYLSLIIKLINLCKN